MPTAKQKRIIASLAGPVVGALYHAGKGILDRRRSVDIEDPRGVTKVLAVRLDAIGDLLLSEPALGVLRQRFPNARIDLAANPTGAELLQGNPNVDRVIPYRAPWHDAWRGAPVDWRAEVARFWQAAAVLRAERYDVGFELRGDPRDIAFLAAAWPRVLVGTDLRGGAGVLDYRMPLDWWSGHQVRNAAAIASAGLGQAPEQVRPPRLYLPESARRHAKALLPEKGGAIALHLGAGFPSKQLPLDKFAAVLVALRGRDPSRNFVIVGGEGERDLVEGLNSLAVGKLQPEAQQGWRAAAFCDLVGKLSLQETAAVLERCRLFIGNDSAPMHLAAAVGTPIVTFFGPSEPWRFRPYGVPHRLLEVPLECRPCDYVHCVWPKAQKYQCMVRQDADAIVAAAEELLRVVQSSRFIVQ